MDNGLKNQWGVADPAPTSSDKQSQEFKAAFQAELRAINDHLQYTAVKAEEARHAPFASRRDALPPAFQSALAAIDPADEAKGQPAIDGVMGQARPLNAEVSKFRAEAEAAYEAWQERQPKLDDAVHKVEELEAWDHPKDDALRALVDGIRKETDKRRYAPAATTLDQLLPKLQPIYDEYLRQKEARAKYEPALAALQPRLGRAAESRAAKLAPMQQEIATQKGQMEAAAETKKYDQALSMATDLGAKLDAYEAAVAAQEQQKKTYEEALANLQPRLKKAGEPAPPTQAAAQQEIAAAQTQMEASAQGEEYEKASANAETLKGKLDKYEEAAAKIAEQKKAYEEAAAKVQPRLAQLAKTQSPKLEPMQKDLADLQGQMETAAQAQDYEKAAKLAEDLTEKLDVFEKAAAELEAKKKAYDDAAASLKPRLEKLPATPPPKLAPMQQEITGLKGEMEAAEQAEDYEHALSVAKDLGSKLEPYETAVTEYEAKKKEYEEALAAIQPRLTKASQSQYAKLEPMQKEITDLQSQMETAAKAENYEEALQHGTDLTAKLDAYESALEDLEKKKADYETAAADLASRMTEAAKPGPLPGEITGLKQQMESAAQSGDYEQALKLADDLSTKLTEYGKTVGPNAGTPGGGVADDVRVGETFDVPWESKDFGKWGATSRVTGSFKVKVKGKGELIPIGKGRGVTAGGTANKGLVAEVELGKQKAIEICESITIKEVKESFNCELSAAKLDISLQVKVTMQTSVNWLSPLFTLKLTILGAEWEKLQKDPDKFTGLGLEAGGGIQAKGKLELNADWELNLSLELTLTGSVKPNWKIIIPEIAAKFGGRLLQAGTRVMQVAEAVTLGEAAVVAGAVLISVAIIYGTYASIAKAAEIRGLYPLSEKATNEYVAAYIAGFNGGAAPGGAAAQGFALGQNAFNNLKKQLHTKYPDADDLPDEEIRDAVGIAAKKGFVWSQVNPNAKQAVWQAFAEANKGDRKSLREGRVNIYGRYSDSELAPYLE